MRQRRIKVDPVEGDAVYHCISRTVNGERIFDDPAKEILRRQLWLVAEYCGVDVVTYAILANHFHVLVRVRRREVVSDVELLRRYELLHSKPTKDQSEHLEDIRRQLASGGPAATEWRRRQLAMMGDLSAYMKLVKHRFSIWFNRSHRRFGTLWAERFKSSLVEGKPRILEIHAAYIDLNCVRAGLAADPKDYRFCGYAEAVAGNESARSGLCTVLQEGNWDDFQCSYRQLLFGAGSAPREGAGEIRFEDLARVVRQGGMLPISTVLRCRIRYFTEGVVLGSRAFVSVHLASYRHRTGNRMPIEPRVLPPVADWGDLAVFRTLRRRRFG